MLTDDWETSAENRGTQVKKLNRTVKRNAKRKVNRKVNNILKRNKEHDETCE